MNFVCVTKTERSVIMANEKGVKYVTPVGELSWVNISGQGKLNYNEDGYNYQANIALSGADAEAFKAKIDEVKEGCPKNLKLKSLGYRPEWQDKEGNLFVETEERTPDEKDGDKLTGRIIFTASTRTTFDDGKPTTINVYNAKGKKVDMGDRLIGNGSFGSLSTKLKVYVNGKATGVSIYLKAVQLTKFVPYEDGGGFAEVEGDFDGFDDADEEFQNSDEASASPQETKEKPRL